MFRRLIAAVLLAAAAALSACGGQPPDSPPAPDATAPASAPEQKLPGPLTEEDLVVGGVGPFTPSADLEARLGKPSKQDFVSGIGTQAWFYDPLGLVVFLNPQTQMVTGWELTGTGLLTRRGVGVGASREDVLKAYGSELYSTSTETRLHFTVPGEPRDLIGFDLSDGKVTKIYIRWW